MPRLPVIVAAGGVNSAGRVSGHNAYRRIVFDALPEALQQQTLRSLATLMDITAADGQLSAEQASYILDNTLVRRIATSLFDADAVSVQNAMDLSTDPEGGVNIQIPRKQLPNPIPPDWSVTEAGSGAVHVRIAKPLQCMLRQTSVSRVQSGGQLPTGFDPAKLYSSRNHPRGLALAIYASSDALGDLGIDWEAVKQLVAPNEISIYGGCALGQIDQNSLGGMLRAQQEGRRITAKQMPLSLPEMSVDFANAYVFGSVGNIGCNIGACASFLYNLLLATEDIRSGRFRISVVGNAEAPLVPEVIEGFRSMRALAEDSALAALDQNDKTNHRRACRPFGNNCGFTLAESGASVILMDDQLALDTGARILGGVGSVHTHGDGFKKSITSPGIGNYITLGRAMAVARGILKKQDLRHHTYVQAHGTSTPQNRVTESRILSRMASAFGVEDWLVCAIKTYVGHSLAPAGADQLIASLGIWQQGIVPGITTIDQIADDVYTDNLKYPLKHEILDPAHFKAVFINSKGFGGNNATALVLSPEIVQNMMMQKHGQKAWQNYRHKLESVEEKSASYDQRATAKRNSPVYQFGVGVLADEDLEIDDQSIRISGLKHAISLESKIPYPDMCPAKEKEE